jgi:hypothetical protein
MYKILLIILGYIIINNSFALDVTKDPYLSKWEYMSIAEAKKRWGETKFTTEAFKNSPEEQRGKFIASLINSKYGLGKTAQQIKNELGAFSGFFWRDSIPVYIVDRKSKTDGKTWQIVFLTNEKGIVIDVKIQNNMPPKPQP